jgi:ammonium transporter, Amt family
VIRLLRKYKLFDDTLDVFCCHGVGGVWGTIVTGFFSTKEINPSGPDGVFYGNGDLLWKQVVVVLAGAGWAFVVSFLLLHIIKRTIGLRVSEEDEKTGLDKVIFGQDAMGFDFIEFLQQATTNDVGTRLEIAIDNNKVLTTNGNGHPNSAHRD